MEKKLLKQIEGMEDAEREKLRELLKDSNKPEEGRLAWMYKDKDKVDSEDYLLGRRIDNSAIADPESTTDNSPGALFSEVITRRSEMDMQVKMREDPLYAIRKKEEEARRRLLENPIKLKQLQKVIERQKVQKKHKDKNKKKKHEKTNSSKDDGDDLLRQYLSIVSRKKSAELQSQKQEESGSQNITRGMPHQSSDRSDADKHRQRMSDKEDKSRHLHHRSPDRNRHGDHHKTQNDSDSAAGSRRKHFSHSHSNRGSEKSRRNDSGHHSVRDHSTRDGTADKRQRITDDRSDSSDRKHSHSKRRSKDLQRQSLSESPKDTSKTESERPDGEKAAAAGYGLIMSSRSAAAAAHKSQTQRVPIVPAASQTSIKDNIQPAHKPTKRKLTEEEMAAKRAEMMQNAHDRDKQRVKNVKRYNEDDERDRLRAEKSAASAGFVRPLMAQHASDSSVEDRIKRNIYNIQRTSAQLDDNFTRR